jgi:hypothetical protein
MLLFLARIGRSQLLFIFITLVIAFSVTLAYRNTYKICYIRSFLIFQEEILIELMEKISHCVVIHFATIAICVWSSVDSLQVVQDGAIHQCDDWNNPSFCSSGLFRPSADSDPDLKNPDLNPNRNL